MKLEVAIKNLQNPNFDKMDHTLKKSTIDTIIMELANAKAESEKYYAETELEHEITCLINRLNVMISAHNENDVLKTIGTITSIMMTRFANAINEVDSEKVSEREKIWLESMDKFLKDLCFVLSGRTMCAYCDMKCNMRDIAEQEEKKNDKFSKG